VNLPEGPLGRSDLVFPSVTGGFRSATALAKPFEDLCTHLKLMTELCSSVGQDEVRAAMEKVVSLAGSREILAHGSRGGKGAEVGQGCEKGCESDPGDEGASEVPQQVAVKLSFS
jgi:hypothetical protein